MSAKRKRVQSFLRRPQGPSSRPSFERQDRAAALGRVDAELRRYGIAPKEWPHGPWEATIAGQRVAIATQGHYLVAVHRDLIAGVCPPAPVTVVTVARRFLESTITLRHKVSVSALRSFASDAGAAVRCATCPDCGNAPDRRYGRLYGRAIMRKDLANILTLADADDVYVGTHDLGSGDHAFVIESETCRAVLMGVREGVEVCAVFGGDGDATP